MTVTVDQNRNHNPNFIQKLVTSKLFWLCFCVFFFAYPLLRSINRELPPELPILSVLKDYKFTDENGKSFGSLDLEGKAYLASFHFTSCPTICVEQMKILQRVSKRVKGVKSKFRLVSYTVNPEVDTPKVLFKKARELRADPFLWKFLTASKSETKELLIKGFKVPLGDKEIIEPNVYDIAHTGKLVLVDQVGQVRAYYSTDKASIDKLMIDLGLLINRPAKQKKES
jgi:protein SCO1/2